MLFSQQTSSLFGYLCVPECLDIQICINLKSELMVNLELQALFGTFENWLFKLIWFCSTQTCGAALAALAKCCSSLLRNLGAVSSH